MSGSTPTGTPGSLRSASVVMSTQDDPFVNFEVPQQLAYNIPDVAREDVMSIERVKQKWDEIFKRVNARDAARKTLVMNAIRAYAVINGTSARGSYASAIVVEGESFSASVLVEILGSEIRQFFRPQAERVHLLLEHNGDLARDAARKWGYESDLKTYAFDFAEYCTSLGGDSLKRVLAAKNAHINSASPMSADFADLVAGPPQRVSPEKSGSHYRPHPGDEY